MLEPVRKFNYKMPLVQRWSDTDELGHVNNAVYLTFFEEARVRYLEEVLQWDWSKLGMIAAKAVIDFKAPLFYTDKTDIYVRVSRLGTKSFDFEYAIVKNDETIVATGTTVLVMYNYKLNQSVEIPEWAMKRISEFEKLEM